MPIVLGRWHRLLHVRALLARWYEREQEVPQVHSWPLFDSQLLHQERSNPRSPLREEGDHEYFIANQIKQKCKKREFLSIHDRFIRDARFRKTMIELGRTEEVIREMDKLAKEEHTHHASEEEISVYRNNWWIRSNFVGSDTMPVRHRADFKEALSTLRRLQNQEDQAYDQNWWQSSSSSWWNWQDSFLVAILHLTITATMDPALIDRGNLLNGDWVNYSWNGSQINLMQNYSDIR